MHAQALKDAVETTRRDRRREIERKAHSKRRILIREMKSILVAAMGGKCEHCGCADLDLLEFDHKNGRRWNPASLSQQKRLEQYVRDFLAGELRLLCVAANKSDGAFRRWGGEWMLKGWRDWGLRVLGVRRGLSSQEVQTRIAARLIERDLLADENEKLRRENANLLKRIEACRPHL